MSNIWLWSTTPINWEVVTKEKIWATQIGNNIRELIQPDDIFIFYIIGTNQIQGIFKVNGEWYDPKYEWPDSNIRDYKSEIKLELVKNGAYQVNKKENIEKLEFFTDKNNARLRNLKLKGNSGYPSNNKEPISQKDYEEILNSMKEIKEKAETVKIERYEDVREIVVD